MAQWLIPSAALLLSFLDYILAIHSLSLALQWRRPAVGICSRVRDNEPHCALFYLAFILSRDFSDAFQQNYDASLLCNRLQIFVQQLWLLYSDSFLSSGPHACLCAVNNII